MADVLQRILAVKAEEVERAKRAKPLAEVEGEAREAPPARDFTGSLRSRVASGKPAVIAEIKKASPSRGVLRDGYEPTAIAASFERHGAVCLSVLTDAEFFRGELDHLKRARAACTLPVLRKDFMVDPYQVAEARALGADCILLIMAALDDATAQELEQAAIDAGMDVLVEVHDAAELDRALKLRSPLLGINNRNLKTLQVDLATTEALAAQVPGDRLLVAESGLSTPADLARMARAGATTFLIGESLMRHDDVAAATGALLARGEAAVWG
jgi:indole-3-glycerol phosphate synthase